MRTATTANMVTPGGPRRLAGSYPEQDKEQHCGVDTFHDNYLTAQERTTLVMLQRL